MSDIHETKTAPGSADMLGFWHDNVRTNPVCVEGSCCEANAR
jgi:hypothetical protein